MTLKHKLILAVLAAIAIALAAHRFLGPGALKNLKVAKQTIEEPQTFALGAESESSSSVDPLKELEVEPDEDHQLAEQALVQLAALRNKPAPQPSPAAVKEIPPVELVREPQGTGRIEPKETPQQASSSSKPEELDPLQERRTLKKRERELIEQLNRQEQQLLGLSERLAEYEKSGSSAEKKVSDLEQRLAKAEHERKISQDELEKKKTDKNMAKLVAQLEDLEQRFNELKSRNDAQSTKLQGESQAKHELETQVSSLQSKALEASKLRQERQDLETRFAASERRLQQFAAEKKELNDRAAQLETQVKVLSQSGETASAQLKAEIKNLSQQLDESRKEYVASKDTTIELKKEIQELERQLIEKNTALNTVKTQLETKEKEAGELGSQLEVSKRVTEKMKELQNELLSAKNQLLIANEQIRLLSGGKAAPAAPRQQQAAAVPAPAAAAPAAQPQAAQSQPADVMIVEVSVEKANLRSAPGKENSPVMQVPLGAQLVVEAREGDWFRVIAPNGNRAYIEKDVVSQVRGGRLPRFPQRTKAREGNQSLDDNLKALVGDARPALKTAPEDPADEEKAFQEIRRAFEANNAGQTD